MKNKIRSAPYLYLYLITFVISVIPCFFYTAPAFEDGLGTMATAAFLLKHDWSEFLAQDGYYYKYGQSLWYLSAFMLVKNPIVRYRIMLVLNSMLTSFIPVICYEISVRYMQIKKETSIYISCAVGLFPSILLYNKYTWAETNLLLLPWLILLLQMKLFLDSDMDKKKARFYSGILALLAVYAFMSHQRGIVIMIATTMTILVMWSVKKQALSLHSYFLCLLLGMLADRMISAWQKAKVYGGAELAHNTLADFLKPEIYQKLFSVEGLAAWSGTFWGWLFQCVCSTFGIAVIGIIFFLIIIGRCFRRKSLETAEDIFALQGGLSFLGAFMLGLLFFFQVMYEYFAGNAVERCDHLLFGRYLESSLPMLLYAGLLYISKNKGARKVITMSVMTHVGLLVFTSIRLLPLMKGVNCYVHSLMSLNLFMKTASVTATLDIIPNYTEAIFAFGIFSLLVSIIFLLMARRNIRAACVMVCAVFLMIYVWNSITVTGRIDRLGMTQYAQFYLQN